MVTEDRASMTQVKFDVNRIAWISGMEESDTISVQRHSLIQLLNIDWTGLIQPKPAHISIDLVRPGNAANTTLDILYVYEYVAIVFGLLCISKEMLLQVIM